METKPFHLIPLRRYTDGFVSVKSEDGRIGPLCIREDQAELDTHNIETCSVSTRAHICIEDLTTLVCLYQTPNHILEYDFGSMILTTYRVEDTHTNIQLKRSHEENGKKVIVV